MKSFVRALRLALSRRWDFLGSVVCALMIAVLWGGNISAVYPVLEIATHKQSLHQWAASRIERSQQRIAALQEGETPQQRAQLQSERSTLEWYQFADEKVIQPYTPDDPFGCLVLIIVSLAVSVFLKCIFMYANSMFVARMSQRATFQLRTTLFRRTLPIELVCFNAEGSADLMNRITSDIENLGAGLNEVLGKLVREPLKMIVCVVGAVWINWRLLLLSLILAPAAAYAIRWLAKALKRTSRRAMEDMSQIYGTLEETFQGIKMVKAFTMEGHERGVFRRRAKSYYRRALRISRYDALARPLIELIGVWTAALSLLAGAYLVIADEPTLFGISLGGGKMEPELLILFYGMLAGISDPARKLSEVFSRIQRGAAAAERIYQRIDREPTIVDPPQPKPLPRHRDALVFDQVSFHYSPSQCVLKQIDLRIAFGETIAIVGPNGCGKSTLANMIARFMDPIEGSIRLDGVDLRDVRMRDLRRQIGLVAQETLLFDDTVYNNILYGSPGASRAQVIEAARRAHAHRFIEDKLTLGYDSPVGPRGMLLSGGQRQRIALARAILRDPAILILDEATSQIDLESEQAIQKALVPFVVGRTTIFITHRMQLLQLAHRVVVMSGGRIVDVGPHGELLRRCDLYGRLHELQFRESA